ncbi:hypothetical protein ACOMHN_039510 [Nucella lapillus]
MQAPDGQVAAPADEMADSSNAPEVAAQQQDDPRDTPGNDRVNRPADDSAINALRQAMAKMQFEHERAMSDLLRRMNEATTAPVPVVLALDSFARDLNDDPDGATPEGQDVRDIELTVFELPLPEEPRGSVHGLESGDTEHHSAESTSRKKGLKRFPGIVGRALTSLSPDRLAIIVAIIVVVIGVLLTVSLLPISFVYVEYYELALAKSRISGKVNREDVYYPGCHLLTPDTELVRFKGTAHFLEKTVGVFTSDRLSFSMRISLQYFIKPEELGQLFTDYAHNYEPVVKAMIISTILNTHTGISDFQNFPRRPEELGQLFTNYAHNYEPVVEAMITSTIQNTAIVFNLDTFRLNRSHVEHTLRQAVGLRLSGNCCPSCCPLKCSGGVNCRACLLAGRGCTKGIHMDLKHFQMGAVGIPEEVSERFLRQTLLLIEAERELFVQKHAVETKISEQMQKDILNKASEIREEATAEAQKIRDIAEADYDKQIQTSYAKALKKFYQHLNITREDHKLSFMYIRALEDISDNLYNLDYDKLTSF